MPRGRLNSLLLFLHDTDPIRRRFSHQGDDSFFTFNTGSPQLAERVKLAQALAHTLTDKSASTQTAPGTGCSLDQPTASGQFACWRRDGHPHRGNHTVTDILPTPCHRWRYGLPIHGLLPDRQKSLLGKILTGFAGEEKGGASPPSLRSPPPEPQKTRNQKNRITASGHTGTRG
jgi:hypothetical protein